MDCHYTINNKRIFTRFINPEKAVNAPVLVLLHEGLGSIELWKKVPEQLAAATGLAVFLYDRQGYGYSDALDLPRPFDYLQREAFDWLPLVLEEAGIKNPILFGHSDGGSIALLYASRYPCTALVIESAHVLVESVTLEGIKTAKNAYGSSNIREKLYRYHGEKTDDLFSAWADTWLHANFADWNIENYLPSVLCPTLVLQGENDEYASHAHVDRIINGLGSVVKKGLLIPMAAHIPHFQAGEETMRIITEFIANS